jgi:hypothetical protein
MIVTVSGAVVLLLYAVQEPQSWVCMCVLYDIRKNVRFSLTWVRVVSLVGNNPCLQT